MMMVMMTRRATMVVMMDVVWRGMLRTIVVTVAVMTWMGLPTAAVVSVATAGTMPPTTVLTANRLQWVVTL